jgi:hypothetical protein
MIDAADVDVEWPHWNDVLVFARLEDRRLADAARDRARRTEGALTDRNFAVRGYRRSTLVRVARSNDATRTVVPRRGTRRTRGTPRPVAARFGL